MDKNFKKIFGFVLISTVLVTSAMAATIEYAYSNVVFTIPVDASFTVAVLGFSPNYSAPTAPGNKTPDIWFNSSSGNDKDVNPCSQDDTDCQDATDGILLFKNVGNTPLNFTVMWNESSMPTGIIVWANVSPGDAGCGFCVFGVNGTQFDENEWNFSMNVSVNNESELFLFANFTSVSPGTYWRALNYTSKQFS